MRCFVFLVAVGLAAQSLTPVEPALAEAAERRKLRHTLAAAVMLAVPYRSRDLPTFVVVTVCPANPVIVKSPPALVIV